MALQNRLIHAPKLHTPEDGKQRRVSWLELFYDLIYVATIIQLGDALSHNVNLSGFIAFGALFLPLWWTWTGFTFFSNRFFVDDFLHRGLVFAQMAGIGAMAVSVHHVFDGNPTGFVGALVLVRLLLAAMYARTYVQDEESRELTRPYAIGFTLGAALWSISLIVPWPWFYLIWAVAMACDRITVFAPGIKPILDRAPVDLPHMTERYGLLTIIVLGESFVKILSSVVSWQEDLMTAGAAHAEAMIHVLAAAAGGPASESAVDPTSMAFGAFLIIVSMWWIYFDDVAGSRIKPVRSGPFVWVFAHYPLTVAITGMAVGVKKIIFQPPGDPAAEAYRWLLAGSLGLALLSVAAIDHVTERRQAELSDRSRVQMRVISGFLVLLLAPTGAFMPAWVFLGLVAGACLVQVAFDLSTAPLGMDEEEAHHEQYLHIKPKKEQAPTTPDSQADGRPPRPRNLSEIVRTGTPNELRRDFYFHLMEGSWLRFISVAVIAYVFSNLTFAAIYLLEPGSISGTGTDSFLHAFSFSVQTMSTIGYGGMSPHSDFGHTVMIVEAFIGVMGAALLTGLLFAKVSRPTSSVLFSEPVIIYSHHGKRTMSFRCGNARGNEVVEASIKLAVMKDEVSPEGEKLRRLHDVKLVRDNTPLFMVSWSVFHVIDESSPFWGLDQDTLADSIGMMIATMTGHDSTYSSTTHARKFWYPEDFKFGHRFVDVIGQMDDGRMKVSYQNFHETRPEDEEPEDDHGGHS
jgi:low temperature requirement protein LtrA